MTATARAAFVWFSCSIRRLSRFREGLKMLEELIVYMKSHKDVWFAAQKDIAAWVERGVLGRRENERTAEDEIGKEERLSL